MECCRATILKYARLHPELELPAKGFTLPCRHCSHDLTWTGSAWELDTVILLNRVSSPEATAARKRWANEVTRVTLFSEAMARAAKERGEQ